MINGHISAEGFVVIASALSLPLLAYAQPDIQGWSVMREKVVSAEELLGGDVSNGLNPIGTVSDLVLNETGDRVEYVLMEVPYPYTFFGGEDGFVGFDRVNLQRGIGFEIDVVIDRDEPVSAPEEFELTAAEANSRLVSALIGERLEFPNEASREIQDVLIDRQSGAITHYIVDMEDDSLFSAERRAIPVDQISVEGDENPSTQIDLATLDDLQEFDPNFL